MRTWELDADPIARYCCGVDLILSGHNAEGFAVHAGLAPHPQLAVCWEVPSEHVALDSCPSCNTHVVQRCHVRSGPAGGTVRAFALPMGVTALDEPVPAAA
jgi:hypothetical protein